MTPKAKVAENPNTSRTSDSSPSSNPQPTSNYQTQQPTSDLKPDPAIENQPAIKNQGAEKQHPQRGETNVQSSNASKTDESSSERQLKSKLRDKLAQLSQRSKSQKKQPKSVSSETPKTVADLSPIEKKSGSEKLPEQHANEEHHEVDQIKRKETVNEKETVSAKSGDLNESPRPAKFATGTSQDKADNANRTNEKHAAKTDSTPFSSAHVILPENPGSTDKALDGSKSSVPPIKLPEEKSPSKKPIVIEESVPTASSQATVSGGKESADGASAPKTPTSSGGNASRPVQTELSGVPTARSEKPASSQKSLAEIARSVDYVKSSHQTTSPIDENKIKTESSTADRNKTDSKKSETPVAPEDVIAKISGKQDGVAKVPTELSGEQKRPRSEAGASTPVPTESSSTSKDAKSKVAESAADPSEFKDSDSLRKIDTARPKTIGGSPVFILPELPPNATPPKSGNSQ